MKEQGISYIELVIVMSVVGIFATVLVFDYGDWREKFAIEKIIKELYTDMMHARLLAVTQGRDHYVVLSESAYSVVEDTNDSGQHDAGDTTLPNYPKRLEYPVVWNNSGNEVIFNKRGLMPKWRTIYVNTSGPDYNCIAVSETRLVMGQYGGGKCRPK